MKKIICIYMLLCACFTLSAQVLFENEEVTVSKLKEHVWVFETFDKTTMYLVEGSQRAMLIDTGTKCTGLDRIVQRFTSKPLDVVITHLHPDHAGNIGCFDTIYLHPADTVMMHEYRYDGKVRHLADGDTFDLGGTTMEIAWMPGHTPGSVVVFDRCTGDCFSGDAFGSGQVWLQLEPHVPMSTYLKSCQRMETLMQSGGIRYIWCGHYPYVKNYFDLAYIRKMKVLAQRLSTGDEEGRKTFPLPPSIHARGNTMILGGEGAWIVYNADKIN